MGGREKVRGQFAHFGEADIEFAEWEMSEEKKILQCWGGGAIV